jgi:putative nucleotidyltransferase with HDIG domain
MINYIKRSIDRIRMMNLEILGLLGFLSLFAIVLSVVVNVNLSKPYKSYKLGEFADRNIKASQSLEFEDLESTEGAAKDAEKHIPPVFAYDPGAYTTLEQKVHEAFRALRQNPTSQQAKTLFEDQIGRTVDDETYSVIFSNLFSWRIERALLYLINVIPNRYVVEDKEVVLQEGTSEIIVDDVSKDDPDNNYQTNPRRLKTLQLLQYVVTIGEVHQKMQQKMAEIAGKFTDPERRAILALAKELTGPNLTFDREKTQRLRQSARSRVSNVVIRVNRGEIVVRDGEPIDRRQLLILTQLRHANAEYHSMVYYFFYFFIFLLTFFSIAFYTKSSFYINTPKPKDVWVIGLFTVLYALGIKIWFFLAFILAGYFTDVPSEVFLLAFPYISMTFLVRVLKSVELSALMSILAAFIAGVLGDSNFGISGYVLFSGFVGSILIMKVEERSALFKAGVIAGFYQMLFAAAVVMSKVYTVNFSWHHLIYAAIAGLLSAVLGAFVAEAIIPVFEYLFNYTTNLKLLEFANTNNPLMRDLLIKAPGTYQHSMIVGQLSSAGADAIGANSLLARVGAYYHDIGKIGKAQYFIENQQGAAINPHDKLNPTMSARILVSHVKDAVKLGHEYNLGVPIIDIIEQHHGTSLMKFFHNKATEISGKGNVEEQDYRYPGPKPRNREAVLVMIADSCEAACRSLEDPTPARVKTTVDTIINNMFVDGQFDESNITLKRLKTISQVYTKTLISLHHSRIQYPDQAEDQYGNIPERRKWDKVTQKIVDKDGADSSAETRL